MRTTNVNKVFAQLTVFASFASEKSNEFAKTPKKHNFFGFFRHLLEFFGISDAKKYKNRCLQYSFSKPDQPRVVGRYGIWLSNGEEGCGEGLTQAGVPS